MRGSSCGREEKREINAAWIRAEIAVCSPTSVCACKRARLTPKILRILTDDEGHELLEEMGIGILESDDSSSSAQSSELLNALCSQSNENKSSTESEEISNSPNDTTICNANFVDPNETLLPCSYKVGNTNIEIYTDNKPMDRLHKKVVACSNSKGRSPLATVACNNNLNNITQNNNNDATSIKKQTTIPDENFFLYRPKMMNANNGGKDPFKKVSDEVLLQVFKWLPKKTLIRCSYVCRRFHRLAQDESLWTRLDLGCKTLRAGALGKIISRGVVILRLAQAEMAHPVFEPDSLESSPEFQSKLQYLDLSMAVITKPSLKMLLSKCRQLKKLSLEHVQINDEICDEIAQNVHLEALNLAMSEGIRPSSMKTMMLNLTNLHSLNVAWSHLDEGCVNALVQNVTPNLLRLNIAGCRRSMTDSYLEILGKRCPGLLELDLSDCTALTSAAIGLVTKFKDLEYLSLSRCYCISATAYMDLGKLTSLSFLDVFGLLSETALQMLQNTFPTVGINKFIHSSVARPTVGTRRTSVWGLRTRD